MKIGLILTLKSERISKVIEGNNKDLTGKISTSRWNKELKAGERV